MPQLQQIRMLAFNGEEIGMGFNSNTGQAIGSALTGFEIAENPAATGAEVTSSISIISTHEELQETLGMSFDAQGRYGVLGASAKAKFSEQTNYNSMSTFVVARVVVRNPLRRGRNFRITEEARALLTSAQMEVFGRAFGDSFVRGLQTGGEFYAIVRITSVSQRTQASLAATLQAEYNGLVSEGRFMAAFEEAKNSESTRSEFTSVMYQRAGSESEISPTVTIEEVIARFKAFPTIAKANPSAYETEVATYDTIPLPIPTPEEQEAFVEALADAHNRKLRFLQMRNDIEFALRFPEFFENPPGDDVLSAASAIYTRLLNAVTQHAIRLARGQIDPPQFFDPGSLNPPLAEPAALRLRRRTVADAPAAGNVMPNLIGQLAEPIISLMSCVAMDDVDHCLGFLGTGGIDAIGMDARALGNFFFVTLRSGVRPEVNGNAGSGSRIRSQFPAPGTPVEPLSIMRFDVS